MKFSSIYYKIERPSLALSEHDIAQTETETEDPNSYCDTFVPLHDDSFPETDDSKVVRTVEVSFQFLFSIFGILHTNT
jgi:hypothetical protein